MPGRYGFRLHEYQRRFPVLPNQVKADPKQSISVVQFWPRNVAFEHGQLLAQGGILQGDLFLTAENEKNETNRNHNRIQHGDMSLRSFVPRIKKLRCDRFWRSTGGSSTVVDSIRHPLPCNCRNSPPTR